MSWDNLIEQSTILINELDKYVNDIVGVYLTKEISTETTLNIRFTQHDVEKNNKIIERSKSIISELNLDTLQMIAFQSGPVTGFHHDMRNILIKKGALTNSQIIDDRFVCRLYILRFKDTPLDQTPAEREKIVTYKYFKTPEWKNQFLNGHIWLGTLKSFQSIENENQGDKLEGISTYHINARVDDSNIDLLNKNNPMFGSMFTPDFKGGYVNFINSTIRIHHPDCYIICSTNNRNDYLFEKDFGKYCVRINDSLHFFTMIMLSLSEKIGGGDMVGKMDEVIYSKNVVNDMHEQSDPVFTKPEHPYKWQDEYRFCWSPEPPQLSIKPFSLNIGNYFNRDILDDLTPDI